MQPAHHLNQPTALEKAFHRDMLQIYQRAKEECGYNATRFLQMVANDGGLRTAQKLLDSANPSDGFVELWKTAVWISPWKSGSKPEIPFVV